MLLGKLLFCLSDTIPIDRSFCLESERHCPRKHCCDQQYYPVCTKINRDRFELVSSPCVLRKRNCLNNNRGIWFLLI